MDIKNVIINEDTAKLLKEEYSMTLFKFNSNMKKFLANLLVDPINTDIEDIFKFNGFTKNEILKHLLDNKILQKECNIDDEDENGVKQKAKFRIRYKLPKNRLDDKLGMLYDILFPSEELNEDGGGATSCAGVAGDGSGSCGFVQPLFGVVRKSKKNVTEAVTGEDIEASAVTYVYCKDKKGKLHILCGKRIKFPDDEMGGKWNPPMGHLHKGESMIDGAIRECFEESGVKLEKKYIKLISKEDYGNVYKVMLPDTIDKYPPKKGDEENGKFKWLPVEEIGSLDWAWTCGKIAKKLVKKDVLNERKKKQNLLESKMSRKAENLCFNIIDKYYNQFFSTQREDNRPIETWYNIFFDMFYHTNTMNDWKIIEVAPLFCELFMSNIHTSGEFKGYQHTTDSWNNSNSNLPLIIKMFNYINDIYKPIKLQKDENGNPIPLQPEIQEIQDKRKNIQYELINTLKQYINKQYDLHILQMLLIKHQKQYLNVLKDLNEKQNQILNTKSNNTETQKKSDYGIELIDSMEQAWKYGQYSGVFDPEHNRYSGQLCFTNNLNQWENFTDRGENTCYVLLKKGWENIKPPTQKINGVLESIHGNDGYYGAEYTAYDSYGMSMIFIFISPDGYLCRSNARWNHGFGARITKYKPGCSIDYEFKKEDIIELLGSDEIFKYGCSSGYQSMIDNGEDLNGLFSRIMELPYGYKLAFSSSGDSDICNIITPNNKIFIDTNNRKYWLTFNKKITNDLYIVSSSFATYLLDFSSGDMDIYMFSLKNLLNKNIRLEEICDSTCDLGNGETYIRINNSYNIVNENGDVVFGDDNLINWCMNIYINVGANVCIIAKEISTNNFYSLKTKNVLFGDIKNYNSWLEIISPISNDFYFIMKYEKRNIINIKERRLAFGIKDDMDTWPEEVRNWYNNVYQVTKDGNQTIVLIEGNGGYRYLTDNDNNLIWGNTIFPEKDLFKIVKNNGNGWKVENYLRLSNDGYVGMFGDINKPKTWFKEIKQTDNSNLFIVCDYDSRYNEKWNCLVLTNDGFQLIYGDVDNVDEWFNGIMKKDDIISVTKNRKRNYLIPDGNDRYKPIFGDINDTNTWFDEIDFIRQCGFFSVEKNYKRNYLIPDGNGGYKVVFGDINDTNTWFDNIYICTDNNDCFVVQNKENMHSFLIPVDKDKGIYRLEKSNEDTQQQNQSLNEIINRLVRNYLR